MLCRVPEDRPEIQGPPFLGPLVRTHRAGCPLSRSQLLISSSSGRKWGGERNCQHTFIAGVTYKTAKRAYLLSATSRVPGAHFPASPPRQKAAGLASEETEDPWGGAPASALVPAPRPQGAGRQCLSRGAALEGSVPDLDVTLPGAGGEDGRQHRVEGGAHTGLRVPVQRARPAGRAEAVEQDPAVGAARHQQVSVRGALAAHSVAFHLQGRHE